MTDAATDSRSTDPLLIDTEAALERLCARLRERDRIALDSEFVRERTYFPRLCLIQVADEELTACIDPLALANLDPLIELLHDAATIKVLHAGRQDLELFYNLTDRVPAPLFDTQIAAGLLGFAPQIGYATLVEDMLDVRLEKAHTRADWGRRPLPPEFLRYAADDVRYLVEIDKILRERLAQRSRLDWAVHDSARLSNVGLYRPDPEGAWRRIRGARRTGGASRRAIRLLAKWREELAIARDRPRQWILRDADLMAIARQLPLDHAALGQTLGGAAGKLKGEAANLLEQVRLARAAGSGGETEAPHAADENRREILDSMMRMLRKRCKRADLDAATVGSRRELKQLLNGNRDVSLLQDWRYEFVGRELLSLLDEHAPVTE